MRHHDDIDVRPTQHASTNCEQTSNDLVQLKVLNHLWDKAWQALTTGPVPSEQQPVQQLDAVEQQVPPSLLVWALVDVARHNLHHITQENPSQCMLRILSRIPPPYVGLQEGEFRALDLHQASGNDVVHCSLYNISLVKAAGFYDALSYCWGPRQQPRKVIFVNKRVMIVTETLFNFLINHREKFQGIYWIDALCIRQDDMKEKSLQIALMGKIYSTAKFVHIWLGPDEDDSGYVLEELCEKGLDAKAQPRFLRGFERILQRPWFRRVWVIQELVLLKSDREPLLWSGRYVTTWKAFSWAFRQFSTDGPLRKAIDAKIAVLCYPDSSLSDQLQSAMKAKAIDWLKAVANLWIEVNASSAKSLINQREEYWTECLRLTLPLLWVRARPFEASDPRDHIYGLLGMADTRMYHSLPIDYLKPAHEVYLDATMTVFSTGSPRDLLSVLENFPMSSPIPGRSTPSWIVDFSFRGDQWAEIPLGAHHNLVDWAPEPTHNTPITIDRLSRRLEVNASIIDKVAHIMTWPRSTLRKEDVASPGPNVRTLLLFEFLIAAYESYDTIHHPHELWQRQTFLDTVMSMPGGTRLQSLWPLTPDPRDFDHLMIEARKLINAPDPDMNELSALYDSNKLLSTRLNVILQAAPGVTVSQFVTEHGLMGLCMPGVQTDDVVVMLFRNQPGWPEIPFVLRENDDNTYCMVAMAWVPDCWQNLAQYYGTREPRTITIR
jgi:hypothetical protein